jgi:hypothetical protein
MQDFEAGMRVRDHEWGGVYTGTITRVDTAADLAKRRAEGNDNPTLYVYMQWDGSTFSEDQLAPGEFDVIPAEGDPEVGYLVMTGAEPHSALIDSRAPGFGKTSGSVSLVEDDEGIGIRLCYCFGEGCKWCDDTGVIYP